MQSLSKLVLSLHRNIGCSLVPIGRRRHFQVILVLLRGLLLHQVAILQPGQQGHDLAGEQIGAKDQYGSDCCQEEDEVVVRDAFYLVLLVYLERELLAGVDEFVVLVLVPSRLGVIPEDGEAEVADYTQVDVLAVCEKPLQFLFLDRLQTTSMLRERYSLSVVFFSGGESRSSLSTFGASVEHCDEKSMLWVSLEIQRVYLMSVTFDLDGLACCRGWYSTTTYLNFEEQRRSPEEYLMQPSPRSASQSMGIHRTIECVEWILTKVVDFSETLTAWRWSGMLTISSIFSLDFSIFSKEFPTLILAQSLHSNTSSKNQPSECMTKMLSPFTSESVSLGRMLTVLAWVIVALKRDSSVSAETSVTESLLILSYFYQGSGSLKQSSNLMPLVEAVVGVDAALLGARVMPRMFLVKVLLISAFSPERLACMTSWFKYSLLSLLALRSKVSLGSRRQPVRQSGLALLMEMWLGYPGIRDWYAANWLMLVPLPRLTTQRVQETLSLQDVTMIFTGIFSSGLVGAEKSGFLPKVGSAYGMLFFFSLGGMEQSTQKVCSRSDALNSLVVDLSLQKVQTFKVPLQTRSLNWVFSILLQEAIVKSIFFAKQSDRKWPQVSVTVV